MSRTVHDKLFLFHQVGKLLDFLNLKIILSDQFENYCMNMTQTIG